MKLNNKGMTLIELLISIVLIGIVLTFLFQILNDLDHETENNNFAYYNQVNRTDIIYRVEQDLSKNTLIGIKDVTSEKSNTFALELYFLDSEYPALLKSEYNEYEDIFGDKKRDYYIKYTDSDNVKYSWKMKGAEIDPCINFTYYIDKSSNNYYFKINVPIYNSPLNERNYKNKNNAVDDLEFVFAGNKSDLDVTNGSYLTKDKELNNQIGDCSN